MDCVNESQCLNMDITESSIIFLSTMFPNNSLIVITAPLPTLLSNQAVISKLNF